MGTAGVVRKRGHHFAAGVSRQMEDGEIAPLLMTNIPPLRQGHVGAQFWSVWAPPKVTWSAAVTMTLEQIDIAKTMVARYPKYLLNAPPYAGIYIGQPERAKVAMAAWDREHPKPVFTLAMVANHIEHIREVSGIDCVGIGWDFDGIPDTPKGLEGVDKYPALLEEFARRGWSGEDLAKLAGGNMLRVMREATAVAKRLQATEPPLSATIGQLDAGIVK